jgi:hypothetical protein
VRKGFIHPRSAAFAVAFALLMGSASAQAAPLRPPPGLQAATTVWSASAPGAVCAIGRTLRLSAEPQRMRSGNYSWHGEVTAEILATGRLARRYTDVARICVG